MPARPLTRPESKARTREKLLRAAGQVIAERGFGAASVDEISARAGFSSGALYSNFGSKNEMLVAALFRHGEEFYAFLAARQEQGSIQQRLAADGDWLEGLTKDRILFWQEIVAQGARSGELRPLVEKYFELARQRMRTTIEQGAEDGEQDLPAAAEELAALILAAEIGLWTQLLIHPDLPVARLLALLVDLVVDS